MMNELKNLINNARTMKAIRKEQRFMRNLINTHPELKTAMEREKERKQKIAFIKGDPKVCDKLDEVLARYNLDADNDYDFYFAYEIALKELKELSFESEIKEIRKTA